MISCPQGLSAILGNELKRLKIQPKESRERGTFVETDQRGMYQINLRSRVANKVYQILGEGRVRTFDQLFDLIFHLDWQNYFSSPEEISIEVVSKNSQLQSKRTIQSIAHKSIIKSLGITSASIAAKNTQHQQKTVLIHLENDFARVMINTSGTSLHERGWRTQTGDAPLKENLAAGLVLLSGWRFKEVLLDPFCGSGTILIEAAMIAKNIAPGLQRNFDFEQFKDFDSDLFIALKTEAKEQQFEGEYRLIARDRDAKMLEYTKENASKAGVAEMIQFEQGSFEKLELDTVAPSGERVWILSNPPYGKRLNVENISTLYQKIAQQFQSQRSMGGIVSSFSEFSSLIDFKYWKQKKLYNGADEVIFWWKK